MIAYKKSFNSLLFCFELVQNLLILFMLSQFNFNFFLIACCCLVKHMSYKQTKPPKEKGFLYSKFFHFKTTLRQVSALKHYLKNHVCCGEK